MPSFTRLAELITLLGVLLVILSYVSPMVQPSYAPIFDLSYGDCEGIMVHCYGDLSIRVESDNNEVFSTFFVDETNGLLAAEEGSLENVTVLQSFINRTVLYAQLTVPTPGWYSILITPSDESGIEFLRIWFTPPIPNLRVLLAGGVPIVLCIPWTLRVFRKQIKRIKHNPS